MKKPLILALLLAIPLEWASFVVYPFPIDVGLSDDAGWFTKVMGLRWVLMHWIGLELGRWFDGNNQLVLWAIVFGGYLEIAVALFLVLVAWKKLVGREMSPAR